MRLALRQASTDALSHRARHALELAREEAARGGQDAVRPEHLLLGCLRSATGAVADALDDAGASVDAMRRDLSAGSAGRCLDADALASIGIDLDEVRRHVEERFGPGALERAWSGVCRLPLTPVAKKTLGAAGREARARGRDAAEPEHVLLALLRDEGGRSAAVLRDHGLAPSHLRAALREELG